MGTKTETSRDTALFVFLGRAWGGDKKEYARLAVISDNAFALMDPSALGLEMYFSPKAFKYARAGQTFRIEVNDIDEITSIYPGTAELIGLFGDAVWRSARDAETREEETQQKERKRSKADPLDEVIAPLCEAYRMVSPSARQQFIARVVYKLTTARG